MSRLDLQKYLTQQVKDNLEARISSIYLLYTSFLDIDKPEARLRLEEVILENIQDTMTYYKFHQNVIDDLRIYIAPDLTVHFHKRGYASGWDISDLTEYLNNYSATLYNRYKDMKANRYE